MKRAVYHAAVVLAASIALFAACRSPVPAEDVEASISSFTLTKADNPELSTDADSVIDTRAKTIRVRIDPRATDFTKLVPTITISGKADSYPASREVADFTQTPVTYKLVEASGRTIVYLVTLAPKPVDAEAGAVRVTEYFCGTGKGTATTGELNRYIELYNGSDSAVDLSQFELVHKRSKNGKPSPALDQTVTLKGSIAAKSYYVIHSAKMNVSLLARAGSLPSRQSDASFNGIMDSDGASGYQLMKDGVVVDAIGPNDGSLFATETCYFRRSDTSTGLPGAAAATWDKGAWALAPLCGLLNEDANAGLPSPTDASLVSLIIQSGSLKIPATINNAAKTATVLMPDGADASSLAIAVGSFGTAVSVDSIAIENGKTKLDFTSGKKTLAITGQDGTTAEFTVAVKPRYTAENYDFDGGIKAVVDKIWKGGANDTSLGDVYITGVVTAKNVFPAAFAIQDKNAGVYFYTSEGITFPVGSKVKIKVNTGKVYFGLPEITVYDLEIAAAGNELYSLYYRTGDYATKESLGSVFRYDGAIAQGGLAYYKGQFAGSLYFHYPTEIQSSLSAGTTGVFYGPVTYTRDNYTMELVTPDQFSIR